MRGRVICGRRLCALANLADLVIPATQDAEMMTCEFPRCQCTDVLV